MSFVVRKRIWKISLAVFAITTIGLVVSLIFNGAGKTKGIIDGVKDQAIHLYSRMSKREGSRFEPYFERERAAIVILCRNEDLKELKTTLKNFEHRFNKRFQYPYIFLNDKPFESKFERAIKKLIASGSGAEVKFGRVPQEHWSFPPWIDQKRAAETREKMEGIMYGGSESYRYMCRYYSGFFYKHPLLAKLKYYWRIEPGVKYFCDIPFDPFALMEREKKKYGFILSFPELAATVPTLMNSTLEFMEQNPELLNPEKNWFNHFLTAEKTFNLCHFWSNFEIASLDFYRSEAYQTYFDFLDKKGGFFYERWGDAPVHSLAVGMFLRHDEVMYFKDIGYHHPPINHCPVDDAWRKRQNCECDPNDKWERRNEWCLRQWINFGHQ